MDEALVIGGREVESAALPVLELRQHHFEQLHCQVEVLGAPSALQQLEQCVGEEGVIV